MKYGLNSIRNVSDFLIETKDGKQTQNVYVLDIRM